jgi:hypothetical protein
MGHLFAVPFMKLAVVVSQISWISWQIETENIKIAYMLRRWARIVQVLCTGGIMILWWGAAGEMEKSQIDSLTAEFVVNPVAFPSIT